MRATIVGTNKTIHVEPHDDNPDLLVDEDGKEYKVKHKSGMFTFIEKVEDAAENAVEDAENAVDHGLGSAEAKIEEIVGDGGTVEKIEDGVENAVEGVENAVEDGLEAIEDAAAPLAEIEPENADNDASGEATPEGEQGQPEPVAEQGEAGDEENEKPVTGDTGLG